MAVNLSRSLTSQYITDSFFQLMFLLGSVVSAVSGVCLHLYTSHLRSDHNFGRVQHLSVVITALLSFLAFDMDHVQWYSPMLAVLNCLGLLFVPTYIKPEEEKIVGSGLTADDEDDEVALMMEDV